MLVKTVKSENCITTSSFLGYYFIKYKTPF